MTKNSFVLAITGPSGSGKSTVSEKLAKNSENCVNIDADHIKHMIVSGFSYKITDNGTKNWEFHEWELVGDNIGLIAKNFIKNNYSVIINGYIDKPAWIAIEKHIKLSHKVMLLPNIGTTIKRDSLRRKDIMMGGDMVIKHHKLFSESNLFQDFAKIDSTNKTASETVKEIKNILNKPNEAI